MKALAALALAAVASAQSLSVELRLAGDADRTGPPAWTWVREAVLPECSTWPDGGDPFAPVALRWGGGRFHCAPADVDTVSSYALVTVEANGVRVATGRCGWSGLETWRCVTAAWCPERVVEMLELLGLHLPGAHAVDVGVLAGHLVSTPAHDGGPLVELVTRGAVEAGEVRFAIERRADELVVCGSSSGGLTLPLAIVLLASLEGEPSSPRKTSPLDERRRWQILAFSARDDARIEAIAQLGRLGGGDSIDLLEHLLWAEDEARASAMESLVRAGEPESLAAVVGAARVEIANTPELAHAALVNLWSAASGEQRNGARLAAGDMGARRGWLAQPDNEPTEDSDRIRSMLLGLLTAAAVATLLWHERVRRA